MTKESNPLIDALRPKQRDFVLAYIETKNATESAKRAGYSEKTSYSIGQRLLKKVEIQQAIASVVDPLVEKQLVTIEEIIKELKDIGMADWRDFLEIRYGKDGQIIDATLKLGDKVKALNLLGDYVGAWKPKEVKHSGEVGFSLTDILKQANE